MWKRYLGPHALIVGIDVKPECKTFEEDQIKIRIGSQSDTSFLESIIAEFGTPDVVLDDGSHRMSDVVETFRFLYPRTSPNGVYMVEDLHAALVEKKEAFWDVLKIGRTHLMDATPNCKSLR